MAKWKIFLGYHIKLLIKTNVIILIRQMRKLLFISIETGQSTDKIQSICNKQF